MFSHHISSFFADSSSVGCPRRHGLFWRMVSEVSGHGHLALLLLDNCRLSQSIMVGACGREKRLASWWQKVAN